MEESLKFFGIDSQPILSNLYSTCSLVLGMNKEDAKNKYKDSSKKINSHLVKLMYSYLLLSEGYIYNINSI